MNKIEYYFEEADKIRTAMDTLHSQAIRNHEPVHPNWYILQDRLKKINNNYRAYCRRHGLIDMLVDIPTI